MQSKKSVLLINPNIRNLKISPMMRVALKYHPVFPLELSYISKSLKQQGIDNKLIDLWMSNSNIESIKNEIKNSDILVFNTGISYVYWRNAITNVGFFKKNIDEIKKINPKIKLIVIGPHGTSIPETFFDCGADYVVRGEPELLLNKLICSIRDKKKNPEGVCYKKNDEWIISEKTAIVTNLDELPTADNEHINFDKYRWPASESPNKKIVLYEASRGCVYHCSFCFRDNMRSSFRKKSIRKIEEEIKFIKKEGTSYVFLIDELFGLDDNWTEQVCNIFEKNNIRWMCQTRPEILNKHKINLFKKSGCFKLGLGLESVDKEILKDIGKGSIKLSILGKNITRLIEKGIKIDLYCTIGFPKETRKSIRQLYEFVNKFPLKKINPSIEIVIPYPHTRLWDLGNTQGFKLKNWEDIDSNIGIIGNNFDLKSIKKEWLKVNCKIIHNRIKSETLRETDLIEYFLNSLYFLASKILVSFPNLLIFYKKTINYIESKSNLRLKPPLFDKHD